MPNLIETQADAEAQGDVSVIPATEPEPATAPSDPATEPESKTAPTDPSTTPAIEPESKTAPATEPESKPESTSTSENATSAKSKNSKLSPQSLQDGTGLQSVNVGTDNGTIDLVAAGGTGSTGTFSSATANAYPLQVIAKFPTGATITNKKIEVILPVALSWSTTGTNVAQITDNLIGSNAGITNSNPWTGYGTTIQRGRVYAVKGTAQGSEVSALTLNLSFLRNQRVHGDQILTNAENDLKVIVSWNDNGLPNSEEVYLDKISLTGFNDLPYFHSASALNANVVAGQVYSMGIYNIFGSFYVDNAGYSLQVAYTPAVTNTTPATTLPTLSMTSSNGYVLSGGTGGLYNMDSATPKTSGNDYIYPQLDLTDDVGLKPGDKITITLSKISTNYYSGKPIESTVGRTITYKIIDSVENISISQRWTKVYVQKEQRNYEVLYNFNLANTGGANSKVKDISIDLSGAQGITGVSPSYMILPAQNGYTVSQINYKLSNGNVGSITGSSGSGWVGNSENSIILTIGDFIGLSNTDYIKEISYTMGQIPAMLTQSRDYLLYGKWLNEEVNTSSIAVKLSNNDGSGTALSKTGISNELKGKNVAIGILDAGNKTVNAGQKVNLNFTVFGGINSYYSTAVLENPVYYIRNESGGMLDMSSIKIEQSGGVGNITNLCNITDMGVIQGAHVYKIDTINVTGNGGRDAWIMRNEPYHYDSDSQLVLGGRYDVKISFDIDTFESTVGGNYRYDQMIFVGHNDEDISVNGVSPQGKKITDNYGIAGGVDDLITINNNDYYQINPKLDAIVTSDAKPSNESAYSASGATLKADDETDINVRTSLINPSGNTIAKMDVFVPIPKKGDNWGALARPANSAFSFDTVLKSAIPNPDPSTFTILYGNITPSDSAATLQAAAWEPYNQANAASYNCIRITGNNIAYINNAGADAAQKLADNSHPFVMTLAVPYDENVQDGSIDSWASYYFEDLTIPGTGVGSGVYQKWQQGSATAIASMFGQLGGTLWLDLDLDGSYNAVKETKLSPKAGWNVYAYPASKFNTARFTADPIAYITDANDASNLTGYILEGSAVSDSSADYLIKLLDRSKSYVLVAENMDTGAFRFTVAGTSSTLPNMEFTEASVTDTSMPPVSTYPAACLSAAAPGHHIFGSAPGAAITGLYDIGLLPIPAYSYTVHYDTIGGTPSAIADKTAIWTDDDLLPTAAPEKTGYTFTRWDVTAGGSGTDVQSTDTYGDLASDDTNGTAITLSAIWEADPVTITFAAGTNGSLEGQEVFHVRYDAIWSDVISVPAAKADAHYVFDGWTPVIPAENAIITESAIYTANFRIDSHTVAYDGNGGNGAVPVPTAHIHGSDVSVALQGDLAKSGYTFLGWDEDANAEAATYPAGSSIDGIEKDYTLYAVWQKENVITPPPPAPDTYQVSYAPGGANVSNLPAAATGLSAGSIYTVSLRTPARDGYAFAGWQDSNNIYKPGTSFTMPNGNVTLTARWEKVVTSTPVPTPTQTPAPAPTAPAAPAPAAPALAPAPASGEPVGDMLAADNRAEAPQPTFTENDQTVPEGAPANDVSNVWALLNLVLAVIGVAIGIIKIAGVFRRREDDEEAYSYDEEMGSDEERRQSKRMTAFRIMTLIGGIAGAAAFILTENMKYLMVAVDDWTPLMAIIFAITTVFSILAGKRNKRRQKQEAFSAESI